MKCPYKPQMTCLHNNTAFLCVQCENYPSHHPINQDKQKDIAELLLDPGVGGVNVRIGKLEGVVTSNSPTISQYCFELDKIKPCGPGIVFIGKKEKAKRKHRKQITDVIQFCFPQAFPEEIEEKVNLYYKYLKYKHDDKKTD